MLDLAHPESDPAEALDAHGHADLGPVLDPASCAALAALYPEPAPFRSHVVMRRHGFGEGEYKYFADPLPEAVAVLRASLYARLVPAANAWADADAKRAAERRCDDLRKDLDRLKSDAHKVEALETQLARLNEESLVTRSEDQQRLSRAHAAEKHATADAVRKQRSEDLSALRDAEGRVTSLEAELAQCAASLLQ